jgi:hypothetical protein
MMDDHAATDPEPASGWSVGFTPDPDDDRPFPEVSEEWVDAQIREIIKAAHAAATSPSPAPPRST